MPKWVNDDGLTVLFENDANDAKAGSPLTHGVEKELHIEIEDGVNVPLVAAGSVAVSDQPDAFIPSGAIITDVRVFTSTAFAGATATIDLGLEEQDGTSIDAVGVCQNVLATDLAVGEFDITGGELGDSVGAILTKDAFVNINVKVAEVTAGKATFVIYYMIPKA